MEITIGAQTPEMAKATEAVKALAASGQMDLSSVITLYDIIYLILFLIICVPVLKWCITGIFDIFTNKKKVQQADAILALLAEDDHDITRADVDSVLRAAVKPVRRKVGSTHFNRTRQEIIDALSLQRRKMK